MCVCGVGRHDLAPALVLWINTVSSPRTSSRNICDASLSHLVYKCHLNRSAEFPSESPERFLGPGYIGELGVPH